MTDNASDGGLEVTYLNFQQRVKRCRENACPTCKAQPGEPCVFVHSVLTRIAGEPMVVHHDDRWRKANGWPFGSLEDKDWPLDTRERINARDSTGDLNEV